MAQLDRNSHSKTLIDNQILTQSKTHRKPSEQLVPNL